MINKLEQCLRDLMNPYNFFDNDINQVKEFAKLCNEEELEALKAELLDYEWYEAIAQL